ncbi:MAG TPA: hypothetical protein VIL05_08285 [Thermoclostridium sp.]
MKKQVLLRWLWCIYEYLMVIPVILIITGIILPYKTVVIFLMTLPLHLLFALVLTSVIKKFSNLVAVLAGTAYAVIVLLICNVTFLTGSVKEVIVVAAGTVIFYIWGITAATGDAANRFYLYSGSLVLHMISLFIINNINVLKPYFTMAMWISIIYCISGLPLANRRFLINETHEKSSLSIIPGSVNRGNRIIVFILLACIIILSFWRTLLDAFIYIARSVAWAILKMLEFLGSLYEEAEGGGGGGPQDIFQLPPAEEKNPIVDIILNAITLLIFAVILFLVIRYIVKNYKRIYRALYNLLSSFFNRFQKWSSAEQGYFDREESLLKTEFQKRAPILKRLFKRYPKWRDMKDNESRVRFIYSKFVLDYIRKGLKFSLSYTPTEVVEHAERLDEGSGADHSVLKDVYNSTRYGAKPVDDETVAALKDKYL